MMTRHLFLTDFVTRVKIDLKTFEERVNNEDFKDKKDKSDARMTVIKNFFLSLYIL